MGQKLYPHVETDLSVIGEIRSVRHLPYDSKPEALAKPFHDLDQNSNNLSCEALREQQNLLHLASQINDKEFAGCTDAQDLFRWMHSYQQLADPMVELAELSRRVKHLAMNQGIATGKTSINRTHANNQESESTPATEGA